MAASHLCCNSSITVAYSSTVVLWNTYCRVIRPTPGPTGRPQRCRYHVCTGTAPAPSVTTLPKVPHHAVSMPCQSLKPGMRLHTMTHATHPSSSG